MPFDDTQRHALNHVDFLMDQGYNRKDTEQQLNQSGFYKTTVKISKLLTYYDDAIFARELARKEDILAALRQTKQIVASGVAAAQLRTQEMAALSFFLSAPRWLAKRV